MATQKKGAKVGRNQDACKAYRTSQNYDKNKIRKLRKRFRHHPNDESAIAAWKIAHARLGKTAPDVKTLWPRND